MAIDANSIRNLHSKIYYQFRHQKYTDSTQVRTHLYEFNSDQVTTVEITDNGRLKMMMVRRNLYTKLKRGT